MYSAYFQGSWLMSWAILQQMLSWFLTLRDKFGCYITEIWMQYISFLKWMLVLSQKDFPNLALWFLTRSNITNLSFPSEGKVKCEQNDIWGDLDIVNSRKCFCILSVIFTGYSSSSYKITSARKSEIGYIFAILLAEKWGPFSLERNISLWQ